MIYADALEGESDVREVLATIKLPTILFTRAREISGLSQAGAPTWIRVQGRALQHAPGRAGLPCSFALPVGCSGVVTGSCA